MADYLQDTFGITGVTQDNPNGFPTPMQFAEQAKSSALVGVDYPSLTKDYVKEYQNYAKDIGIPALQASHNVRALSSLFNESMDEKSFQLNYNRLMTPAATATTPSGEAGTTGTPDEESGFFGSMGEGIGQGASSYAKALTRQIPLAIGSNFKGGTIETADGAMDLSPDQYDQLRYSMGERIVDADTSESMLTLGAKHLSPAGMAATAMGLYPDEALVGTDTVAGAGSQAASGIIDFTKPENPNTTWVGTLGRGVGQVGTDLAVGMAGGAALGGTKLAFMGANVLSAGTQMYQAGAEDYLKTINDPKNPQAYSPAMQDQTALLNASLASLEVLPVGRLLKSMNIDKLDLAAMDKITGGVIGTAVYATKSGAKGAVTEGGTELLQQVASNLIASEVVQYDKERNMWMGAADNAEAGALVGGFMNTLVAMLGGRRTHTIGSDGKLSDSVVDQLNKEVDQENAASPTPVNSSNREPDAFDQTVGTRQQDAERQVSEELDAQQQAQRAVVEDQQPQQPVRQRPVDLDTKVRQQTRQVHSLLNFIKDAEAPQGYNQVYGKNRSAPLDTMTIEEVMQYQKDSLASGETKSTAVGGYQFMNATLKDLVKRKKVRLDEKLTPEVQDRLAIQLMRDKGLKKYLNGEITQEDFANKLSGLWAGLPKVSGAKKGKSAYTGDGLNEATVTVDHFNRAFEGNYKTGEKSQLDMLNLNTNASVNTNDKGETTGIVDAPIVDKQNQESGKEAQARQREVDAQVRQMVTQDDLNDTPQMVDTGKIVDRANDAVYISKEDQNADIVTQADLIDVPQVPSATEIAKRVNDGARNAEDAQVVRNDTLPDTPQIDNRLQAVQELMQGEHALNTLVERASKDTDNPLSNEQELAIYEALVDKAPKSKAAILRHLRDSFGRSFRPGRAMNQRAYVTQNMAALNKGGLLDDLTTAYLANPNTRFSLSKGGKTPLPASRVKQVVERTQGVNTFETTMPDEVIAHAESQGIDPATIKGAYHNGKLYINPDNISSVAEVEAVVMEEMAHKGLRESLGDKYTGALTALHKAMGGEKGLRAFAKRNDIDLTGYEGSTGQREALMDEVVSKMATKPKSLSVRVKRAYKRVIGAMRSGLRKLGLMQLPRLNDADIAHVAVKALKAGRTGKSDTPSLVTNLIPDAKIEAGNTPDTPRYSLTMDERNAKLEQEIIDDYNDSRPDAIERHNIRKDRAAEFVKSSQESLTTLAHHAQTFAREGGKVGKVSQAFRNVINTDHWTGSYGIDRRFTQAQHQQGYERSAISHKLEDDAALYEAVLRNIFGKPSHKLNESEREQMYNVMTDPDKYPLPDPKQHKVLLYFRSKIDHATDQLIESKRKEIAVKVSDLSDDGKQALQEHAEAILDRESDITDLPLEIRRIANIKRLLLTLEDGKGAYIHRTYKLFHDEKYAKKVIGTPEYNDAVAYTMKENEVTEREAKTRINMFLNSASKAGSQIDFVSTGGVNTNILKKRNEIPAPIRKMMGEIKDPVYNYVNSTMQIYEYVMKQEYQRTLLQTGLDTGMITSQKGGHDGTFVESWNDQDTWGVMHGYYTTPEFKQTLQDMGALKPVEGKFMSSMVMGSAMVKVGKTVLSPTTAMRNLWSGYVLLAAGGHSPFGKSADAYRVLANGSNKIHYGGDITLGKKEAQEKLYYYRRHGIVGDGATSSEMMDIYKEAHVQKEGLAKGRRGAASHLFGAAQKFYAFGDDYFRIMYFEQELADLRKAGFPADKVEAEAARRTSESMPTYSRIPLNIRKLRRMPVTGTFVSFPWEVMRTTKNNWKLIGEDYKAGRKQLAAKRAIGQAVALAVPTAISAISATVFDVSEEDQDAIENTAIGWEKNQLRMFTGKDNNGIKYLDMTALVSSESLIKPIRHGWANATKEGGFNPVNFGTTYAWDMTRPYLSLDILGKTAMEVIHNRTDQGYNIYGKGKKFEDLLTDPLNNGHETAMAMAHIVKGAAPGAINNVRDFYRASSTTLADDVNDSEATLSFLTEVFGDNVSRAGKRFNYMDASAASMGFRTTAKNMPIAIQSQAGRVRRQLDGIQSELSRVTNMTVPMGEAQLDEFATAFVEDRQRAYHDLYVSLKYLERIGMSPRKVVSTIYKGGGSISKGDLEELVAGRYPSKKITDSVIKRALVKTQDNPTISPEDKFKYKQQLIKRMRIISRLVKAAEGSRIIDNQP